MPTTKGMCILCQKEVDTVIDFSFIGNGLNSIGYKYPICDECFDKISPFVLLPRNLVLGKIIKK